MFIPDYDKRCQMTFYLESIFNNWEFPVLKNKDSRR